MHRSVTVSVSVSMRIINITSTHLSFIKKEAAASDISWSSYSKLESKQSVHFSVCGDISFKNGRIKHQKNAKVKFAFS